MTLGRTKRARAIREFLIDAVRTGRSGIASSAADHFGISRQAVYGHLAFLTRERYLETVGGNGERHYRLGPNRLRQGTWSLAAITEDRVYASDFAFIVEGLPKHIEGIWHYGFTEMLNNAIDHSGGADVTISARRSDDWLLLSIEDNGEGIFRRITRLLALADPREALLELSKGKLTTDPQNHTGEGIFFTSRAFDIFAIWSGDLLFTHMEESPDDVIDHAERGTAGTMVHMMLKPDTDRTLKSVFDAYTDPETFDFSKTIVPVRLALYEGEQLISRSQAKRIMNRVERFRRVMLDFSGVEMVGRSFVDEIFRVFVQRHPEVELAPINMQPDVRREVGRLFPLTDGGQP